MRIGPLLQYFCSSCGKILKENTTLEFQREQLKEECLGFGAFLIDTLQNRRKVSSSLWKQNEVNNTARGNMSSRDLSVVFKTAYGQIEDTSTKLAFDIEKIDALLNLNAYRSLCLIGEQRYTQLLINRLCVHSLLPKRYGGITGPNSSKIIVIDAGNCTDVYQFVNFARQYGLEVKKVLRKIVVSRVFTIYQLAHLVVYELLKIIEQLSSDKKNNLIIVIYDLLDMFMSDHHIDKADAKRIIKEIAASITERSEDRFVVVSMTHCNREYEKPLFPAFDNMIRITNDIENSRSLRLKVSSQKRTAGGKGIHSPLSTKLRKQELLLVPPR
jgi:hypothetical protein